MLFSSRSPFYIHDFGVGIETSSTALGAPYWHPSTYCFIACGTQAGLL